MKLLNDVIRFGRTFGQLTQVAQIGVVIALVVVAFSFGNCNGKTQLDNFMVQYETLQKTAKQTTQFADSLNREVAELSDSARQQDAQIKKLTISISFKEHQNVARVKQLSQLERRAVDALADSNLSLVVAIQDTVIDNVKNQLQTTNNIVADQQQIIESQSTQILSLREAVHIATIRGDTLQSIINALPKKPSNPDKFFFGLIPKPNRTVIGIVAFATGIAVGSQVGR